MLLNNAMQYNVCISWSIMWDDIKQAQLCLYNCAYTCTYLYSAYTNTYTGAIYM